MGVVQDFETLGLKPGAPPEDVVDRYRRKAAVLHPDNKLTGNTIKFTQLNTAYRSALDYAKAEPCDICQGTKKMKHSNGFHTVEMACTACGQTGRKHRQK